MGTPKAITQKPNTNAQYKCTYIVNSNTFYQQVNLEIKEGKSVHCTKSYLLQTDIFNTSALISNAL